MKFKLIALKCFKPSITPLKIALIYAAVGILWMLFSDKLLAMWVLKPDSLLHLETLKGWFYVLVTAWMLYALTHRSVTLLERSEQSLRKANQTLRALSACNRAIIETEAESDLMRDVCRVIVEIGSYRMAWVGMAQDTAERRVHPLASWGDEGGHLESLDVTWNDTAKGRGPVGTAIRSGATCVFQNIVTNPHFAPWRRQALDQGYGAAIALPLTFDEKTSGALCIYAAEPNGFDAEETNLLEELATNLSYGITILRLRTERNRMHKERTQLATMVEQAEEGMLLVNIDGTIQYTNPAFERICGLSKPDIQGQNILALTCDEPNQACWQAIADAFDADKLKIRRFTNCKKDGTTYQVDVSISAVHDSAGALISHMVVMRDITHEAQLEKQLQQAQKMEVIGAFSGGIAHDFNNILGAIINCSELALENLPVDHPVREDLEHVLKAGLRGKHLVQQIRTFSRRETPQRLPVEIDLVVKECLSLLRASLPAGIELRPNLAVESSLVLADATQMHQVLMNLCVNAAHAMGDSEGVLHVSLGNVMLGVNATTIHPDLQPGPYLTVTVGDNGCGMQAAVMERIFDPFFTTRSKKGGTGLGLSVVHGIVKSHDGAITVESEPGKGSTLNVFLPLADSPGRMATRAAADRVTGGSERILLVDDEEDLTYAGQKILQRLGYTVITSSDGLEALATFRAAPRQFDLVITDQTMPQMKGTDLAREILRIRPDIPIILCSGYGSVSNHVVTPKDVKSLGIRAFVAKPVTRAEMAAAIRRELDTAP
ncbi:hybrid sensor histidine kinase/response regulator [Desulfobacter hydrogenophilus]|nr:ATP-binding protein [Desulfobacter hydrogenophilus]NDY71313.1 GAF domain-containing protein [Desulfobacter hydrogenophilus]